MAASLPGRRGEWNRFPSNFASIAPDRTRLRAAKSLVHALVLLRRLGVVREGRLVFERLGEDGEQLGKRGEIVAVLRGSDHRFYPVTAGNVRWIEAAHRRLSL